jgi:D-aminoacyl-tRNA deacylase
MPILVFSKGNTAGEAIAHALIGKYGFMPKENIVTEDGKYSWRSWSDGRFKMIELTTMHIFSDQLMDYSLFNSSDLIVMLSTHKSEANLACVSIHSNGNFGERNRMGGNPRELAYSSASAQKIGLAYLSKNPLEGFPYYLEATHHGPTAWKSPIVWVEIGSTEKEYANSAAGELMTNCAMEICEKWKSGEKANPNDITALGFGGTHYCAKFSKLILEGNYEFSYIFSKHLLSESTPEMIKQAIEKSVETVEIALIEKKSINAATREKIIADLKTVGLNYELV